MASGFMAGGLSRGIESGFNIAQRRKELQLKEQQIKQQNQKRMLEQAQGNIDKMMKTAEEFTSAALPEIDTPDPVLKNLRIKDWHGTLDEISSSVASLSKSLGQDPMTYTARIEALKKMQTPGQLQQQEVAHKGAIAGAQAQAQADVKGPEYKRFGAFSKTLGERFTAFDDGKGGLLMRTEEGLVPAPLDTAPVSAQLTGGESALGLTKKEGEELRGSQRDTRASIDTLSTALREVQENPDATGIKGFLSENIGGILGQVPSVGKDLESWFTQAVSGASPEDVARVRTRGATVVAQMIDDITAEESGRYTEAERDLARNVLKQTSPKSSVAQITSAMKTVMEISVASDLRNSRELGAPSFDLSKDDEINRFGKYLEEIGFNTDDAARIVKEQYRIWKR